MNKIIFISFLIFLCAISFAQDTSLKPTKNSTKSISYFRTVEYFDQTDSTKNYGIVYRPNAPAKCLLILLPGFGESPPLAEMETNIPIVAAQKGMLTVLLSNNEGNLSFQIDANAMHYLDSMIPILLNKYNIPNDNYYLGGFSLGGSSVVKYVQHCNVYDIKPKPKAVFAIDPPLDFNRLYHVYERWLNDTSTYYMNKLQYKLFIDKMQTYFRGDVSNAYQNYLKLSPYCYEDKNNVGARLFEKMPVSIYCEPDFNWAISEKHWNAYDLNVLDNVSFINELQKAGNKNAKLILTENKGKRKLLNQKHPHSWSIAEANEVVNWLLKY
ncbi:MAG: hypothetical protein U0U67_12065 [Chitinophagales bacterium]